MATIRNRILRRVARRLVRSRLAQAAVARPCNARGDVLDPAVAVMLAVERRTGKPPTPQTPIADRRAAMVESCWLAGSDPMAVAVRDGTIGTEPSYRVRYYEPPTATAALVFLHGGGWAVGDLDTHDSLCRRLAIASNRVVVAVDYPLAPEHRWPGPIHSVVDAYRALHPQLSARFEHIGIGGDSAGGNLATSACRLLRADGPLPDVQLLIYPGLDATRSTASHREFADGFLLTEEGIGYYLDTFGPDPLHPLGSPGLADDLEGLPAAIIAVAGFDPLRDEGLLYADRLQRAGIEVALFDFPGMVHGFANMDGLIDRAADHVDSLGRAIFIRSNGSQHEAQARS